MTTIDFKACRTSKAGNIITPKCRMSFPVLFDPKSPPNQPDAKKRFSVALLIPPGCDLDLLKAAAKAAATEKWGDKKPANLKNPLLDAGKYEYNGYVEGWTLLRPTTLNKPGLVGPNGENISDESEVYAGRWCVASLRAYAYDVSGNRGISFGLQNIQLLDHDESLGGRAKAEDEFAPVDLTGAGAGKKAKTASADEMFD